jgi:hypothetical protein
MKQDPNIYSQTIGEPRAPVLQRIITDFGPAAAVTVFHPDGAWETMPACEVERYISWYADNHDNESFGIALYDEDIQRRLIDATTK